MRVDSLMPVSCTISRHGATPAKPWRTAAATASGSSTAGAPSRG
jgi:hypothetical protein